MDVTIEDITGKRHHEWVLEDIIKDSNCRRLVRDIVEDISHSRKKGENDSWIDFSYTDNVYLTAILLKRALEKKDYTVKLFHDDDECNMTISWG